MLLAIDAGNTNVVFALVKAGEIRARWRIATDPRRTADEYAVWLRQLLDLEGYTTLDVEAVIIGTVVPRATHNLEVLASKYFGVEPLIAGQGKAAWPIALEVDEPHNVGADRALNAMAAHAKYEGDLVIVDFGTATTFDVVGSDGAYRGGIIAPGINLSIDALVSAAAKLPRIAIEAPKDDSTIGRTTESQMLIGIYWGYVAMMEGLLDRLKEEIAAPKDDSTIGRTTESQMLIGIYWGYVAMMEGLLDRLKKEIAAPITVIGTGGLAALFDKRTDVFDAVEPDLTIQGLSLLYERIAASA